MRKAEYLKTHTLEQYEAYKKKQAELTKKWREKNREKSRKYGLEYYYNNKRRKEHDNDTTGYIGTDGQTTEKTER